ncbi:hypothetical protein ACE7GA_11990 [Roseomonas sp. CCTCC AB2023176]|uniref:hypothetical protein n=1 Tax=Roseomonas sp. CCTCC AB2023176 TaxID=3342640 RepID=UPI0035DA2F16
MSGTIAEDRRLVEAVDRAARNASVRGLILVVDSPGGTVAGVSRSMPRCRGFGRRVSRSWRR